jgi:Hepatocellular carcinoma-associated antigen 59
MAYIEENLKARRQKASEDTDQPSNGQALKEDLLKFEDKYKTQNTKLQEGSVTSSLAMLTAIPEVDLGME